MIRRHPAKPGAYLQTQPKQIRELRQKKEDVNAELQLRNRQEDFKSERRSPEVAVPSAERRAVVNATGGGAAKSCSEISRTTVNPRSRKINRN